jgi:biopolymer transport protein ExbB/TolQ
MNGAGQGISLFTAFQQGGVAMYPLLLASIVSVAIVLDRNMVLYRAGQADRASLDILQGLLSDDNVKAAESQCQKAEGSLALAMKAALACPKNRVDRRQGALDRALAREASRLERHLPILATLGSVSPFVGLFGTVLGIMRAFRDISAAGAAGSAVVAAGIAEALITTAAGLIVAVVAVVAYNHLMTWAQRIITDAELNAQDLVSLLPE